LLDVGAGQSPWRDWLHRDVHYVGLDIHSASCFGMTPRPDLVYFDGRSFPLADRSFDTILCIEVLEHVANPAGLLAEIHRVARPGAQLLLTVPWSARRHHIPNDFYRYSREALAGLLAEAGFADISIGERGNDVGVIANKLLVLSIRLLRPSRWHTAVASWVLGVACLPITAAFVLAYHLSIGLGYRGGREDPLGYAIYARRPSSTSDSNTP
jgi:SAM-dependent methyltransferase